MQKRKKILILLVSFLITLGISFFILINTHTLFQNQMDNSGCNLETHYVITNNDILNQNCLKKEDVDSQLINCTANTHYVYIENKKYYCGHKYDIEKESN